jgi:hypothetical protein
MPKTPRTQGAAAANAPAGRQKDEKHDEKHEERTAKVDLPFVTAEFHAPHLPRMRPRGIVAAARSMLPPRREAVYYGGLALLAAFELIEWPVAVAIGVGAAVMGRGHGTHEDHEPHAGDGHQRRERTPAGRRTPAARRR